MRNIYKFLILLSFIAVAIIIGLVDSSFTGEHITLSKITKIEVEIYNSDKTNKYVHTITDKKKITEIEKHLNKISWRERDTRIKYFQRQNISVKIHQEYNKVLSMSIFTERDWKNKIICFDKKVEGRFDTELLKLLENTSVNK
ncbi:MAG: hypothetical protein K0S51_1228 [Bacillales bacterium]|jgi:hypothetical protein|nr:hypothetical protein [Bacillales bacterium]